VIIVGESMIVPPTQAWKLALAVVLCLAILVSASARAPRRSVPGSELRRLVASALLLYAVGALASLRHHAALAAIIYAGGIGVCAFAAWLSRGHGGSDDGPDDGDDPSDERPPPGPDGVPRFDWPAFERELWAYTRRHERRPVGVD
jgi:hypothetical protein